MKFTTVGRLPTGYEIAAIVADASTVAVEGARRNVQAVDYASANVNVDSLTTDLVEMVKLQARNGAGRTIGGLGMQPDTTTVSIIIARRDPAR